MQNKSINRSIILNSRPIGAPRADNFKIVQTKIPTLSTGQILLRTVYLSLDPYMRGRMSDAASYAEPVALGAPMVGAVVARVESSQHPDYQVGDWVVNFSGWQDYAISDGTNLSKLSPALEHKSLALGVLGMPGLTAYMGLLDIGQPQEHETVVVAAASGAVGSLVGQIAKLKGARVIGIAGSQEKCDYVTQTLGFDACINHHDTNLSEQLKAFCPQGIDVYFENVGGLVFDAVLPLLNTCARVPVCGMISNYNRTEQTQGIDRLSLLMSTILIKRIRMQGFIVFNDYGHRVAEFRQNMEQWLSAGKIKFREDIIEGLENAPNAFMGLLEGKNFGKLIIKVGNDAL